MPLALVTCGPAYEPIDGVRRITNHSTGELGTTLSTALHAAGFEVVCLRGEMATHPAPRDLAVIPFSTNSSLERELEKLPEAPAVIFHAAALCDFTVSGMSGPASGKKIRSDASELILTLIPAGKILPLLRPLFSEALIVGWKYELEGTRDEAITRARSQISHARTDACVVNGSAYGAGFGLVESGSDAIGYLPDKAALSAHLVRWTQKKLSLR